MAQRPSKVSDLPRIDDCDRKSRHGQRRRHGRFIASGRFEHDERRRVRLELVHQGRNARGIVRHAPRILRREDRHIEVRLSDVDADIGRR
jgi:hypothetical protein